MTTNRLNFNDIADRQENILQYEIAQQIINDYKYTFSENSYYWNICHQMEKMLLDSIDEQWMVIKNLEDNLKQHEEQDNADAS
jgi:hypothetical protein